MSPDRSSYYDKPNAPGDRVKIYQDQADEWRWRYVAANGKIMADSGEGYIDKDDCYDACAHVLNGWIDTIILGERVEDGTLIETPVEQYVQFVRRADGTLLQIIQVQ